MSINKYTKFIPFNAILELHFGFSQLFSTFVQIAYKLPFNLSTFNAILEITCINLCTDCVETALPEFQPPLAM